MDLNKKHFSQYVKLCHNVCSDQMNNECIYFLYSLNKN